MVTRVLFLKLFQEGLLCILTNYEGETDHDHLMMLKTYADTDSYSRLAVKYQLKYSGPDQKSALSSHDLVCM
jgi:hypothetical protein